MGVGEKIGMYFKTVTSRGRNMLLFKSYERWHDLTFKISCLLHIAGDVDNAKYLLVKQNLYQIRRPNTTNMVTLFFLPHPVKFMIKDKDGEFSCYVKYDKVRKTFVIVFIGENQEDCVSGRWCASSTNYSQGKQAERFEEYVTRVKQNRLNKAICWDNPFPVKDDVWEK
jgi:hypothetical protein